MGRAHHTTGVCVERVTHLRDCAVLRLVGKLLAGRAWLPAWAPPSQRGRGPSGPARGPSVVPRSPARSPGFREALAVPDRLLGSRRAAVALQCRAVWDRHRALSPHRPRLLPPAQPVSDLVTPWQPTNNCQGQARADSQPNLKTTQGRRTSRPDALLCTAETHRAFRCADPTHKAIRMLTLREPHWTGSPP